MSKKVAFGTAGGVLLVAYGWLRWLLHGIDHGWKISNIDY